MVNSLTLFAVCLLGVPTDSASPPPPLAEKYLHEGRLVEGEVALLLALDANPKDDEARFGLGVVQFARALANVGKALYEYGALSRNALQPHLKLPVPKNERPSAVSYRGFGRMLDSFVSDLGRAEATLAGVQSANVELRLRLAPIRFDLAGTGDRRTTLVDILGVVNGSPFEFQKANPEMRFHFDRGDVAWLRSYCHLLSALVEGYRSVDDEPGFSARMTGVYPNVETPARESEWRGYDGVKIGDAPRLRRMRLHLVAVCELNRETWEYIRKETDDDHEWLPNARQTDRLGLPIGDERIDAWLAVMSQLGGVLKGERLISGDLVSLLHSNHPSGMGLNLKKVFDDPPVDLFNLTRIREKGIDAKFLDPHKEKALLEVPVLLAAFQAFSGPFGFATMARMN